MKKDCLEIEPEGSNLIKRKRIRMTAILALMLAFVFYLPIPGSIKTAQAAITPTVDYTDETITVATGSSINTKIYVSVDNQRTWELVDTNKMDISTLLSSRVVTLYFKGNIETTPVPFALSAEDRTLKPVYQITSGVGSIVFTSTSTVQCRKGQNGQWFTVTSPFDTSMYESRGAVLYFRTAPQVGVRAGYPVAVRIPKRPTAPSVRVDGSKLNITGVKATQTQYRVGNSLVWLTYMPASTTANNYIDLYTLLGGNAANNIAIPAGTIEFRTPGLDKKISSSVKVIDIPQQTTISPTAATLVGTTLTINDPDRTKQYEYTTLASNATLDFTTARWSTVSYGRPVIVPRVNLNDSILIRVKSSTDKTTKNIILASTYLKLTVTSISTGK